MIFPVGSCNAISGAIEPTVIALAGLAACTCPFKIETNSTKGTAFVFSATAFAIASTLLISIDLKAIPKAK